MKEENNGTPKNKWSRIFRTKWFFPAVYLTVAALLLSAVVWYQNMDNRLPEAGNDHSNAADNYSPEPYDEDALPVQKQQESIKTPLEKADQAEIVTKFFDYNADQKDKENALVLYNNRFYQSTGVDYASADDSEFNVTAALSGKVTKVKEDPLLGNVVELTHENGVTTHYASLGEVKVDVDANVKQGDVIGTSGKNLFGKDKGNHLHFEIRKDKVAVNPETYINQPVSKIQSTQSDDANSDKATDETNPSATDKSEVTDDQTTTNPDMTDDTDKADDSKVKDDPKKKDEDGSADADTDDSNAADDNGSANETNGN